MRDNPIALGAPGVPFLNIPTSESSAKPRRDTCPAINSQLKKLRFSAMGGNTAPMKVRIPQTLNWRVRHALSGFSIRPLRKEVLGCSSTFFTGRSSKSSSKSPSSREVLVLASLVSVPKPAKRSFKRICIILSLAISILTRFFTSPPTRAIRTLVASVISSNVASGAIPNSRCNFALSNLKRRASRCFSRSAFHGSLLRSSGRDVFLLGLDAAAAIWSAVPDAFGRKRADRLQLFMVLGGAVKALATQRMVYTMKHGS
mmetsp:Transcript_757/g.947  ORF Transcript_757/g.947 Transcript_757/m.947 type:complete len:258 (+) Transcript_757:424-1197(+)